MSLVTWFPRFVIIDFLLYFDDLEKYHELYVAVIWSKWQSKVTGIADLAIGIPVLNKKSFDKAEEHDLFEIKETIDKLKDDNSTIDVVVSSIPYGELGDISKMPNGWNFQIKRYRTDKKGDVTLDFRNFIIKKVIKKYPGKHPVRLIVVAETAQKIDFKEAVKDFDWDNFPFTEFHFMYFRDGRIYMGEVWPDTWVISTTPKAVLRRELFWRNYIK